MAQAPLGKMIGSHVKCAKHQTLQTQVPGNGAGSAGEKDQFNPQSPAVSATLRGEHGKWWDRRRAAIDKKANGPEGRGLEERTSQKLDEVGGGGRAKDGQGRLQELASIYGVKISDDDARKFFSKDYAVGLELPNPCVRDFCFWVVRIVSRPLWQVQTADK